MEATPENIKSIFPEFAAVSDSRIENFIEIASLSLSEKVWGSSFGIGLSYLTAHLLKRAGVGGGVLGGSSNPGVVSSEKVGELQRSYALPNFQGSSAEDSLLGTTSYGIEYLRLRRQILVTPNGDVTMGKFKVIDKDRGWKRIAAEFRKASQSPFVKVGFVGSSGEATHKNSTETVASIAADHEFGSDDGRIPERSFIRGTLIKESGKVQSTIDQLLKNVLFQKIDVQGALGRLGLFAVSLIKDRIVNEHIPPPLAQSTIEAKTRDGKSGEVPLVDTGQMLNSIRHEVIMDGRNE